MNDKDISRLYQAVVVEHNRNPHNFGRLTQTTHQARGYNPVCGDAVTVYLNVHEQTITDAAFEGDCCAVCTCSASLLTDRLKGMTLPAFRKLLAEFERLLHRPEEGRHDKPPLEELKIFAGIKDFPSRVPCANLPWHTALAALDRKPETSTE